MACNLVVCGVYGSRTGTGDLVEQPDGEAGVETHEEHLLHDPHAIAESFGGLAIGERLGVDIFL